MGVICTTVSYKGEKKQNQDRLVIDDLDDNFDIEYVENTYVLNSNQNIHVAAVFDGVTGCSNGGFAASIGKKILEKEFKNFLDSKSNCNDITFLQNWAINTLSLINDELINASISMSLDYEHTQTYCTTVAILIWTERDYMAINLGDSSIYKALDKNVDVLSKKHTLYEYKKELNLPRYRKDKHVLQCCLGFHDISKEIINVHYGPLAGNERFILFTDGLTNLISERGIKKMMMKDSFNKYKKKLYSKKDKLPDNTTLILLTFK